MPIASSLSLNESRRDVEQASGQPGDPCADAASCDSGQCLGGTCCQPNPTAWTNCADCGWNAGFCLACVTGYSWVTGAGCTAPGGVGAAVGDPHLQNVHGERFD